MGQAIKAQATASSVAPTQGKAVSKISGSPTVPTSTAATQKQEFRFLLLNGDETWTLDTKVSKIELKFVNLSVLQNSTPDSMIYVASLCSLEQNV